MRVSYIKAELSPAQELAVRALQEAITTDPRNPATEEEVILRAVALACSAHGVAWPAGERAGDLLRVGGAPLLHTPRLLGA